MTAAAESTRVPVAVAGDGHPITALKARAAGHRQERRRSGTRSRSPNIADRSAAVLHTQVPANAPGHRGVLCRVYDRWRPTTGRSCRLPIPRSPIARVGKEPAYLP